MTRPLRTEDVTSYLTATGWTVSGTWRAAQVWSREDYDVLVPPDDALADTGIRLRELVLCVAAAEGRTPRVVRREMAAPELDVISYRPRPAPEEVSLPAGMRAVRALRDLLAGSARAVADETTTASDAARALLEQSMLSLPEQTFGLDVALPITEDDTFARTVSLHVFDLSVTARHAVVSPGADTIADLRRIDVSASVTALADLGGASAFDLHFRWSRRLPRAEESVAFPPGSGERLRAVGKRVDQLPLGLGSVRGQITSLVDDDGDRWRIGVRGTLAVDGVTEDRQRQVPVRLAGAEDYAAALAAHRDGHPVGVHGPIARIARSTGIVAAADGFTVHDHP
ncbi:hypothetical protein ACFVVM_06915 [Nocardia sp. NPDC058176]|uniref:hypothetical protein n=1 Tax=Nocardia sp. NPDC058176 TaxID=3346368 RepID=UPI0036DEC707